MESVDKVEKFFSANYGSDNGLGDGCGYGYGNGVGDGALGFNGHVKGFAIKNPPEEYDVKTQ